MKRQDARRRLGSALDVVGMHAPLARLHERWRAARATPSPELGPDGLPFPPASLRVLVDWHGTPEDFIARGSEGAETIRAAAAEAGVELDGLGSILDFGCGCGRIARHWARLTGPELHGCDYNRELVDWCAASLPFMQARVNALEPPSPYPDDSFDLVYAISVLTHLTLPVAHDWIADFRRILRPGGLLLVTTHGDSFQRHLLTDAERERYASGEPVVQRPRAAGMNACAAYHPPSFVSNQLLREFEVVKSPELAGGSRFLDQDLFLARAPG